MSTDNKRLRGIVLSGAVIICQTLSCGPSAKAADSPASVAQTFSQRDGSHDFDFEIGAWKTHLRRLLHPLSGSTTWVDYDGTSIIRKVWNGHANLVELDVQGPKGHIEALSLRLYNPVAHQWSLNFSNSACGTLGTPTVGESFPSYALPTASPRRPNGMRSLSEEKNGLITWV